ncbi:hypothetical protein WT39_14175 [Burkholderia territorii]|nr:hypothetical protein WT39_14175 [Burkholderia territorii]
MPRKSQHTPQVDASFRGRLFDDRYRRDACRRRRVRTPPSPMHGRLLAPHIAKSNARHRDI